MNLAEVPISKWLIFDFSHHEIYITYTELEKKKKLKINNTF